MRNLFFLLILISLGNLSAQEYEVDLRLSGSSNFYRNLHPNADYQLYGFEPELLSEIIALHGKGLMDIYGDFPARKIISPDSLTNFFDLPDYSLLDSLVDWEEIYFSKEYRAWFPEGFENYDEFESDEVIIDSSHDDSMDGFDDFGPDEIIELDSTKRDSLTGRDQIRLFVEYDVYLEEIWEVAGERFEITADWIRIDIIDRYGKMDDPYAPEMPEEDENDQTEFPFSLVKSSLYISAKDWIKLKPEWIFEKKWTARKGKDLPGLIKDRNFPAVLSTICPKNDAKALFINHRKGFQWKDSLLNAIAYPEYCLGKAVKEVQPESETLEDFKIELRDDTIGLNYRLTKEELALLENSKAFLASHTYQEVLNLAFSDKIQKQYSGYRSLDKSSQKKCDCNYTSSLFLKGELVRSNEKVRFSPQDIIVVITEKKGNHFIRNEAFTLELEELEKYGLLFQGEALTDYLAHLDYFFFPISINKSQIHSFEKSFQIKDLLMDGNWEEIKQSNKYLFGCEWYYGIDPNPG